MGLWSSRMKVLSQLGVPASAFYVAWPTEEFLCRNRQIFRFCSNGGTAGVRASTRDFVKEPMGERGLQVYVNRTARCDELSSGRSMNSNFDSCGNSLLCATVRLGQEYMQGRHYQIWRHGRILACVSRGLLKDGTLATRMHAAFRNHFSDRHICLGDQGSYLGCPWQCGAGVPNRVQFAVSSMNSNFDSCGNSLLCATVRLGQEYMQAGS